MKDTTIYEASANGRTGYTFDTYELDDSKWPVEATLKRPKPPLLPQVSENQVVRHYTNLSNKNYGVDTGMYPLGSCTMKYNPKINEVAASISGFQKCHPLMPQSMVQGSLRIIYELQGLLSELTGMSAISLQPAAGSQGELTGLMMIKAYHLKHGNVHKCKIIIPDSAHGTNPASVTMAGYETVEIPSNEQGTIDIDALKEILDEQVAGLMLTNPNTLGLFEKDIKKIADMVHDIGGLLYYDGANMNANMGITRPLEMGFDVVHLNLHKTLSTPHGGGGPGSGPVGVVEDLVDFLPGPIVSFDGKRYEPVMPKSSIGHVKTFYGNFGIYLRAYVYLHMMGNKGLKFASEMAVLNANYMRVRLEGAYKLPYKDICKHEFVLQGLKQPGDCVTMDVAKRLIDLGYHPPTIYFPLIVEQALMVEPTESESLESLDEYIEALLQIAGEAKSNPELLKEAPRSASVRRLDEVAVARHPKLTIDLEAYDG